MKSLHPTRLLEGFKRSIVTYTRLPLKMKWEEDKAHTSPIAFLPYIGVIVALLSCWPVFIPMFDSSLTALFMLLSAVLITGAFHEDGFMDSLDGLIGGIDQKQRLVIMKDSRLGSYAALGIWFLLAMKWLLLAKLLTVLSSYQVLTAWFAMHLIARSAPLFVIHRLDYVSAGKSKAVHMITTLNREEWLLALVPLIGLFGGLFWFGYSPYLLVGLLIASGLMVWWLIYYLDKKIAGYTGDTLGAVEQLIELLVLFAFVFSFSIV